MKPRAVVIGSGVAGLTSAILLAGRGWDVTVLEQHTRAGGLLHRFFRQGVGYDTGFHYVGSAEPDQLVGRMLRHLGVYDRLALTPLDDDGFDLLRFPGLQIAVPRGLDRWMERLGGAFPHERAGLRAYAQAHREAIAAYGWYTLDPSVPPERVVGAESTSLRAVLDGLFTDERLKAVLAGQAALYGVPPKDAPFGLHAVVTDHFLGGAWTIDGGGDRLALALVARLRALGGRIRFRALATAVEVASGHVAGVVAREPEGDKHLPAELVVANIHPRSALALLPDGVTKKAWRTRIEGLRSGRAHLGVYLRVRGDLSDLARRNLYRFRSFDPDDADRPATADDVPFWFLTAPGARSPVGADGAAVVLGLTQLDWATAAGWADAGTYAADKERLLDAFVEAARGDHPDWEVVRREASTPLTTFRYTRSPEGACYGLYHSVDQMGRSRVPPYGRVPGLWMVGQAVGFPGICGAMVTAYVAASGILGGSLMEEVRA